ncbi:DUF6362 family protein [Rhizobium sp. No.120]
MNQTNALPFDRLCENAATVADVSLVVRARFVEAADTFVHLSVRNLRPGHAKSYWPDIQPEPMDQVDIRIRFRPSAAAISRAEEVFYGWMLELVKSEENRILLSRWSICMAARHIAGSFRDFCKNSGRSRSTSERRLRNEFNNISGVLIKKANLLHQPDWSRVVPMMPNSVTDLDKVETPMARSPGFWLPEDAKPVFDPDSPDLEALSKRLEKANKLREREARRRAKLQVAA